MQTLSVTMNGDNQTIILICIQLMNLSILTPQTKQAGYSAMEQENTEIETEINMDMNAK